MNKKITVGIDLASGGAMGSVVLWRGFQVVLMADGRNPAAIDPEWINGLRAGRKDDREQLALAIKTIALSHGANFVRRDDPPNPDYRCASISIRITIKGVGAMVNLDDLHGGDCALIHWHNSPADNARSRPLAAGFKSAIRGFGNLNPYKATTCCADWLGLAKALDAGLLMAARREAFETPTAP